MRSLIALVSLFAVVASSSASAKTLRVPKDHATIQAAVNAADPGDHIKVANGVFIENVSVPAGKDGLVIEGSGKTIIDARVLGNVGSGAAIICISNGFVARRLTVRHAKGAPANGIHVFADDATLDRVTALHCEDYGLVIVGDRARVDRCVAIANGIGISIVGNDGLVSRSTARASLNAGIFSVGADNLVERCRVLRSDFDGIVAAGSNANVKKCRVDGARDAGIVASAAGTATIEKNDVRHVSDSAGIVVAVAIAGFVSGNRVADVRQGGILLTATNLAVTKNRVERSGKGAAGILVAGNGSTISDNLARRCLGDGFFVAGGFHTLQANRALQNDEDGFDVAVAAATLLNNIAIGNAGEGLENGPAGSTFVGNHAHGNRVDVVNAGVFATFEANVFKTGGVGQLPELDL